MGRPLPGVPKVAPSVLSADFGNLAEQIGEVLGETDWIHVDVMDGHFVPNLTVGPPVVASLRKHTAAFLDCHLMVEDPESMVGAFLEAGADLCTVHVEAKGASEALEVLRSKGAAAGLALNPETPIERAKPYLEAIDLLLVMTVHPGFAGQGFIEECLPKVRSARQLLEGAGRRVLVQVDGGINPATARLCRQAGADVFVSGSFVFSSGLRPWQAVAELKKAIAEAEG